MSIRFGIYTSFYNSERFIDAIFENIKNFHYDNFVWIVTDDFSTDNTKAILLKKVEEYKQFIDVRYAEQNCKKELYWKPNLFFSAVDYIVLVDADDIVDLDALQVYDNMIQRYPDTYILSSDFKKIWEGDKTLHSMSLIENKTSLINKLTAYHPSVDYLNNISYSCFGHLRCFKNDLNLKFEITDMLACAEDSYHMMWGCGSGKWLHIPRNLYHWQLHSKSESHSAAPANFNGNFDIAYNRLKQYCYEGNYDFADIQVQTNSLNFFDINTLAGKKIAFIGNPLSKDSLNKLRSIYFDCLIDQNQFENFDIYVVLSDVFYRTNYLKDVITKIKEKNPRAIILIYSLDLLNHPTSKLLDEEQQKRNAFIATELKDLNLHIQSYLYIRHIYLRIDL